LGASTKVVYKNSKPTDFEKSQRVVMKGSMVGETFECQEIILKCPSKYTDEKGPAVTRMVSETPVKTTE
jgi:cytochrome c-type biogenesis protein CcmE